MENMTLREATVSTVVRVNYCKVNILLHLINSGQNKSR